MIARRLASRTHSFRIIDMAPVDTGQKANANLDHNEETENATRDHLRRAQDAAEHEKATTFLQALEIYPAAVGWSVLLSTAIIMEGYDMKLIGSLNAQPAFAKRYGQQLSSGKYEIPAPWQAGLSNGATIGSLVGLYLNGYVSERIGFKKTMLGSLALMTATIFIPFFAPSIEVLLVGQICQGIPWGVFQTLTTAYAAEVCPVHLRGYLTTYVNLCWVSGRCRHLIMTRALPVLYQ
jgi:SP family general alpha glucoside:H+ symporter-like MFS transporter